MLLYHVFLFAKLVINFQQNLHTLVCLHDCESFIYILMEMRFELLDNPQSPFHN